MRRGLVIVALLLGMAGVAPRAVAVATGSPEDVLTRYLGALKAGKFDEAYGLISAAMRQGKSQEQYVKESQVMMGFAEVKIFDFTVFPATLQGDKALVPNILESQDRFVNTLGLTEYELYTLVREDGVWKVDAQTLIEPADQAKWFPKKPGKPGKQPADAAPGKPAAPAQQPAAH